VFPKKFFINTKRFIDASHPVPGPRLSQILTSFQPLLPQMATTPANLSLSALAGNLTQYSTPFLAHLIALFSHPSPSHPPSNTGLIIIDSFSTLISSAFPRTKDATSTPRKPGGMFRELVNCNSKFLT